MIFSVRYFEEGSSCRGRRKPPWRLQVEWRLERGLANRTPSAKSEENDHVPDLCAPPPRRFGLRGRVRDMSRNIIPGQKFTEVHFATTSGSESAHKSGTWCFQAVFDGTSAHNSGTSPHRATPTAAPVERNPANPPLQRMPTGALDFYRNAAFNLHRLAP